MALGRALLCAAAASLLAGPASALSFNFVSGTARITAQVVGQPGFLVDTIVDLDGTFIDFDTAPVSVPNFQISIAPTGTISMSSSYGGYDSFVINSALLVPGTGYTSAGVPVGGSEYSVLMGPVQVNAVYSAMDSTATNAPINNIPLPFTNPSLTASVDTNLVTFEMMGITLGVIPGALMPVPELNNLIVKGDITFVGEIVPEPGTGALLGFGLLAIAGARRRTS